MFEPKLPQRQDNTADFQNFALYHLHWSIKFPGLNTIEVFLNAFAKGYVFVMVK